MPASYHQFLIATVIGIDMAVAAGYTCNAITFYCAREAPSCATDGANYCVNGHSTFSSSLYFDSVSCRCVATSPVSPFYDFILL